MDGFQSKSTGVLENHCSKKFTGRTFSGRQFLERERGKRERRERRKIERKTYELKFPVAIMASLKLMGSISHRP